MYPIFPLFISVLITALIVNTCLMRQRVYKRALLVSILNVIIWIFLTAFYKNYIKSTEWEFYYDAYVILSYLAFLFIATLSLRESMVSSQHYTMLTSAIKNTKFNVYYTVDSRERIRDISDSLMDELGLARDEIIGKKLFDVFDRTIRFTKINDVEVNNRSLRDYYTDYRKKAQPRTQEKLEIQFQNYNGKAITLNVVEKTVFINRRYWGRIVIGEKKSNSSLMNVEKELIEKNSVLESIRHKFIATLELTEEGIFYNDLDQKYIWGTDNYTKTLGLPTNTINVDDFYPLMHQDDLVKYVNILESLTRDNPRYSISYRYRKNGQYVWIKEVGKRIFEDENSNVILGFVKMNETQSFDKTGSSLDSIKDEVVLQKDLTNLLSAHRFFEVAIIKLSNIPEINERHNRSVGTMMMTEYVTKLRQNFVSESSEIYRISGLEFALTITDARKIDLFKKLLESDGNSLNLLMEYGSIREVIKVKVGIAKAHEDAENPEELVKCAKRALHVATSYDRNYCYYRDVK